MEIKKKTAQDKGTKEKCYPEITHCIINSIYITYWIPAENYSSKMQTLSDLK